MGRHSIPDPEDSPDERGLRQPFGDTGDTGADDAPDTGEVAASESETTRIKRPDWDSGEWTGSHRAVNTGRRGVSVGVIVALVTVVVVVGVVIVWRFFGDALSDRSDAAAARCVDGDLAVAVLADPTIADHVQALADRYNDTASPVGDRCVKVGVKSAESDQVVNGFGGSWPGDLGERPALWVPASGVSEARLEAVAGAKTVSDSRSLVSSPVVLAVRPQLRGALARQSWGSLPGLQSDPAALDGLGLRGWGSLKLALPLTGDGDATYLAAEAVAAAAAPDGAPPTAGMGAVSTLMAGQPRLADDTASTAMDALLDASEPDTADVHAVVTTEQQLFQRGAGLSDAKNTLASWLPPGPTALADYPTVLLSGDWLSQEQVAAASEFARFMRKPEQLAELAGAGFRTEGATPPDSDVTNFADLSAPLSVGDNAMRTTLADALTAPVQSPAVTIMLDQSLNLAPVVSALNTRIGALPPTAAVGLTTFDGGTGTTQVNLGRLSDDVEGQSRAEILTSTLDGLAGSAGGRVSFTTLRNVYAAAQASYRQGQPNSILVITSGPHTDQSLGSSGLLDMVRQNADPARPVTIDVINVGNDPDRDTWESVAQLSGGTYQSVPASDSPEMLAAVTRFLA